MANSVDSYGGRGNTKVCTFCGKAGSMDIHQIHPTILMLTMSTSKISIPSMKKREVCVTLTKDMMWTLWKNNRYESNHSTIFSVKSDNAPWIVDIGGRNSSYIICCWFTSYTKVDPILVSLPNGNTIKACSDMLWHLRLGYFSNDTMKFFDLVHFNI